MGSTGTIGWFVFYCSDSRGKWVTIDPGGCQQDKFPYTSTGWGHAKELVAQLLKKLSEGSREDSEQWRQWNSSFLVCSWVLLYWLMEAAGRDGGKEVNTRIAWALLERKKEYIVAGWCCEWNINGLTFIYSDFIEFTCYLIFLLHYATTQVGRPSSWIEAWILSSRESKTLFTFTHLFTYWCKFIRFLVRKRNSFFASVYSIIICLKGIPVGGGFRLERMNVLVVCEV